MRTLRAWLIVMLLLHQFHHHHHHESMACLEQEKMALLAFKASVPWTDHDDTSSGRLPSWVEDDDNDDCCSWEREFNLLNASLFLPFQELRHLDLSENGFRGLADNEGLEPLGRLKRLEVLDLSHNHFDNSILPSLGALKSLKNLSLRWNNLDLRLCKLRNLQELDLSGNDFVGSFNHCLGNLTSLRALDLSHNQFEGSFDTSFIAGLTSIEYLSLSLNRFQGSFSFHSFANLSKLDSFQCEYHRLIVEADDYPTWVPSFQLKSLALSGFTFKNGAFPSFLYYQQELRVVQLSRNNLKGEFPIWLLENNTKLQSLNLANNSFTGPLVLPPHPCVNLSVLILSNNNFSGSIPTNIGVIFPNLGILKLSQNYLSNNNLSGQIPEHLIMGSSNLAFLKLSYNNLYGKILHTITNLTRLKLLYLAHNFFSGNLQVVYISHNNISGPLPRWLGNLSSLESLVMRNNHLEGSIPSEFCQLHLLRYLDLSENNIQGSIPSYFSSQYLEHVHLQKNMLEGPMTNAFSNNTSLVTLGIRDNHLNGGIPEWIGGLSSLNALILKGNQFEGQIPVQLCELKNLNIMDFSHNFLSGSIPSCLNNIKFKGESISYERNLEVFIGFTYGELYSYKSMLFGFENDLSSEDVTVEVEVEFTTKFLYETYKGVVLELMSGIDLSCNKLVDNIPSEIGDLSDIRALNLSYNYLNGQIPPSFSNLRKIDYEGNPLLCGEPLRKNNCTNSSKASPSMQTAPDGMDMDMDMYSFVVSFVASYITVLLGLVAVFYINPYWRRVWFYLIDVCITSTYYFVTNNIQKLLSFSY
uniref:Leucine-rich repeat-containing N-terminal plant-type domain-containing protein n=1 Tax=Nelumbo nucifera TaxID=4432 RepID=A0A822YH25_NELNU|nr:TPA_asm: hypothetical protein HUJ06_031704 [Nelumbo nucifera]